MSTRVVANSGLVVEKEEEAKEQEKITGRITRRLLPTSMSSRLVEKLWVSGREEREAKEKEQAEVTGRLLSTMSSRLVTKLVVSGQETRESERERASGSH
jgi:hypothetical protein